MKVAYDAENIIDAHLVKGLLAQQGIHAWVRGEHLTSAIGELPPFGLVAVMVADEDYAAARACIEDWQGARVEPDEDCGDDGQDDGFLLA